jgi:hypothetical protein
LAGGAPGQDASVRTMLAIYVLVIAGGLAFTIVVGLTHG